MQVCAVPGGRLCGVLPARVHIDEAPLFRLHLPNFHRAIHNPLFWNMAAECSCLSVQILEKPLPVMRARGVPLK